MHLYFAQQLGDNARARVLENWSWHHTALRTIEQYELLLDEFYATERSKFARPFERRGELPEGAVRAQRLAVGVDLGQLGHPGSLPQGPRPRQRPGPSPDASAFVKVGQKIEPGAVLCIVEAMKLMNEIESEISGEIVEVLGENGKPVEYGDRLFKVRTA